MNRFIKYILIAAALMVLKVHAGDSSSGGIEIPGSGSMSADSDSLLFSVRGGIPGKGITSTNAVDTGITIENGDVWVWGFRGSGQQGNGRTAVPNSALPARVQMFVTQGLSIIDVAAGIYHIIAVDEKGDVWGWGQNGYKEAGGGVCGATYVNTPCKILSGQKVVQIEAGEYISFALTIDGRVYAWGHNLYGEMAVGSTGGNYGVHEINFNEKVVLIGGAYEGGYAITKSGAVYGWGDDQNDSFGIPHTETHISRTKPIRLEDGRGLFLNGSNIEYICGGEAFTAWLDTSGQAWGMGRLNMLGQGVKFNGPGQTAKPVKIKSNVASLYCRFAGSIAITNDGDIYTWGSNLSNDPYYVYGESPTYRSHTGKLTKIDGGKEHLLYWNTHGDGYGVGYGAANKLSASSAANQKWPGSHLQFVITEMKKVYGTDYIVGGTLN